jgi:hypothetical protein
MLFCKKQRFCINAADRLASTYYEVSIKKKKKEEEEEEEEEEDYLLAISSCLLYKHHLQSINNTVKTKLEKPSPRKKFLVTGWAQK